LGSAASYRSTEVDVISRVVSDDFALGDLAVTVLAPEKVVAELVRQ
jgi:hypothetical protein